MVVLGSKSSKECCSFVGKWLGAGILKRFKRSLDSEAAEGVVKKRSTIMSKVPASICEGVDTTGLDLWSEGIAERRSANCFNQKNPFIFIRRHEKENATWPLAIRLQLAETI